MGAKMKKLLLLVWITNALLATDDYEEAMEYGDFKSFKKIMESNSDRKANIKENGDWFIEKLIWYVEYGEGTKDDVIRAKKEQILNYILDNGANTNVEFNLGRTRLIHEAVELELYSTIEWLVKNGIAKELAKVDKKVPLTHYAKSRKMVDFLIKNKLGTVNDISYDGKTLLHKLFQYDKYSCKNLGAYNQFIGVLDNNNRTPLDVLASHYSTKLPENLVNCFYTLIKQRKSLKQPQIKDYNSEILSNMSRIKLPIKAYKIAIEKGADIEAINYYSKKTAISTAVAYNNLELVKLYAKHGASLNRTNTKGLTLLMEASVYGYTDIVKFLLSKEINVDASTKELKTALSFAIEENHIEIVKLLEAVNAKKYNQIEIDLVRDTKKYLTAIRRKNIEDIRYYLDNTLVDINTTFEDGTSPLYDLSITIGNYNNSNPEEEVNIRKILSFLIDRGISLSNNEHTPETIMRYAMYHNRTPVVKSLLRRGVKLEGEEIEDGFVNITNMKLLKFLLKVNPKLIDSVSYEGHNIFTHNVTDEKYRKFFLDLLPLIEIKKSKGFIASVLSYFKPKEVIEKRKSLLIDLIYAKRKHKKFPVWYAKKLINLGVDVNYKTSYGKTALMEAVYRDVSLDFIKYLILCGNKINDVTIDNIHLAHFSVNSSLSTIEYLKKKGMRIDVIDKNNYTPLMRVLQKNCKLPYVKPFVDKKTINHKNNYGKTALNYAISNGDLEVIEFLKKQGAVATSKDEIDKKSKAFEKKEEPS